jgi:aminodeoxyfutalosine deaminase
VFGPDPSLVDRQLDDFRGRIAELKSRQTARVRLGLSPHAPYSVSGALYERVARLAREEDLPLAVHVAESAAESALLESASGPFARLWEARGISLPALPGRTPIAWLGQHGVLGPETLCIHAIRVSDGDISLLAELDCAVAHCPRSNRRHGHGDAPLRKLLDAGIRTAVGTDSAASVYPLDLLADVRAAASLGGMPASPALELVMLGAARALGLDASVGSLTPGKWGDCAIIRIADLRREEVAAAILASRPGDVVATFLSGREVYRRP